MSNDVREHVKSVYSAVSSAIQSRVPQELIVRSWTRCLNEFGLDPGRASPLRVVDACELRARCERLSELVAYAKLEMTSLYQQLADSQSTLVLSDAEGVILSVVCDPLFAREAAGQGICQGAIWSEEEQGTNGMWS